MLDTPGPGQNDYHRWALTGGKRENGVARYGAECAERKGARYLQGTESALRRPNGAAQLQRKLCWVLRIQKLLVQQLARLQLFLGRSNDEPKYLGIRIIENLAQ